MNRNLSGLLVYG